MHIRSPRVDENSSEPFEKCVLGRKRYADVLTNIVKSQTGGMVMAIDNRWGTGKTTFVKMWAKLLEQQEFSTVYYNAWENDFEQDVLTAILAELGELSIFKDENTDSFKDLVKKAAPLTRKLLPSMLKALVKRYTDDEFVSELFDGAAEVTAAGLASDMSRYSEKKQSLKDFKSALEDLLIRDDVIKPIVVFIDELDRCRPDYAVHTLEVMKHFFDVNGIVFVLSIDKIQLGHAIRGVYNSDRMDAEEYLRRFIDLTFSLPEPPSNLYVNHLYNHYNLARFYERGNRTYFRSLGLDKSDFISSATIFFELFHLTLRQQEKLFASLSATWSQFDKDFLSHPSLVLFLLLLKQRSPETFEILATFRKSPNEVLLEISRTIPEVFNVRQEDLLLKTEALLLMCYIRKHCSVTNLYNEFEYLQKHQSIRSHFVKAPGGLDDFLRVIQRIEQHNSFPLQEIILAINLIESIR